MHKLIIHWVHLDINVQLFIPIHSLVHSLSYLTFLLAHSRSNTLTHSSSLSQTLSLKLTHSNSLTLSNSLSLTHTGSLTPLHTQTCLRRMTGLTTMFMRTHDVGCKTSLLADLDLFL